MSKQNIIAIMEALEEQQLMAILTAVADRGADWAYQHIRWDDADQPTGIKDVEHLKSVLKANINAF